MNTAANVQNTIIKYLDDASLMQLVTWSGQRTWVATVFYAADNRHYIYLLSPPTARHSHEIERNNQVIANINLPHEYGMPWQGLQLEGTASLVPVDQIEADFQAYAERYDTFHRLQGILSGTDESRLYQLVPTSFVLYDQMNFPTEPRQEWRIGANEDAVTPAPSAGAASEEAPYNPMDY